MKEKSSTMDTPLKECPICDSKNVSYDFSQNSSSLYICNDCGHIFLDSDGNHTIFQDQKGGYCFSDIKNIVNELFEGIPCNDGTLKVLQIGGEVLNFGNGFEITYIDENKLYSLKQDSCFDICIFNDIIDNTVFPIKFLQSLWKILKQDAVCFFYVNSRDSINAKKYKYKWKLFENLRRQYFNNAVIENALCKCGFSRISIKQCGADGIIVRCQKDIKRVRPLLSVIIPVYNEEKTILDLLNSVYNKKLEGIDKEYIIIESNSKDNTRKIVSDFVGKRPEIKLLLEDKPQGKGHAVRAGFKAAQGDFIIIQDGDLEYDINDYDSLLLPLTRYQKAFVLGLRHHNVWKMRAFSEQKTLTTYVNFGHLIFTKLINFVCKTKTKDPFTMYKTFRRECLYGLEFDGNRFEIDWEIMIKLCRKGYKPIEIPINYKSRSFKEGKKVSMFLDPLIWLKSFIRYGYLYKIK
ncbi:MAG: glycosyltransferase family 2 protein [Elusimicrobiota bacterium]|jgi:glycosyltransferase involved in cell wall biosynthesis|nr:glycosyltransferase family 2 protein [Elusimicrobiota bacterium]